MLRVIIYLAIALAILTQAFATRAGVIDEYKLAEAIYFESGTEPVHCQAKVAFVVMNRVADDRWPQTVFDVIEQPWQFSYLNDGPVPKPSNELRWAVAMLVAKAVLSGSIKDTTRGATHYVNLKLANPRWRFDMEFIHRCGDHWFYKE